MTNSTVRTRFAPSPTGYLHIGGARTALYNYLLAKKHGGKFILRIEDTDLERSTPEAIDAILESMNWLGLTWDEGPFFQTKRFDLYNEHVDKLVAEGKAYPCFCTSEDLNAKRKTAVAGKIKYRYDRTCHRLSPVERENKIAAGVAHCIRFLSEDTGTITVDDQIKGKVLVDAKELDDLIIRRTDGSPTYNFCVVVDDALMGITHVVRGDDHLNNTPRQIQLYQALGYPTPVFAHCSMILGEDKQKLSKRHGAVSATVYRDQGYLPQAVLNYLVRLGWSYKDQEIFTMSEMIKNFSLDAVSPSAAIFDTQKLQWLNGHYIREAKCEDLAPMVKGFLQKLGAEEINDAVLLRAIKAGKEKVKTLVELAEFILLFFKDVPDSTEALIKTLTPATQPVLKRVAEELASHNDWTHDALHAVFEKLMAELGLGMGKIANPVRVALSGQSISPGVFDLLEIFGKEKVLKKIETRLSN